jgi:hypothetical protein
MLDGIYGGIWGIAVFVAIIGLAGLVAYASHHANRLPSVKQPAEKEKPKFYDVDPALKARLEHALKTAHDRWHAEERERLRATEENDERAE